MEVFDGTGKRVTGTILDLGLGYYLRIDGPVNHRVIVLGHEKMIECGEVYLPDNNREAYSLLIRAAHALDVWYLEQFGREQC